MNISPKISLLILAMLLLSGRVHSQVWVLSTAPGETIDSVTVGSRAGYAINYDPTIKAMTYLDPSVFDWKFSNNTPILNYSGSALSPLTGGFYTDTIISAVMPDTVGLMNITVHEKSQLKGFGCADPVGQKLDIRILPRPTIALDSILGVNNSQTDFKIPVLITGYGPWRVTYTVSFGSAASISYTDTVGTNKDSPGTIAKRLYLYVPKEHVSNGSGDYTISIINIGDRISNKSIDQSLVASQPADLPMSSYVYYILPTPLTPKVLHQKNK